MSIAQALYCLVPIADVSSVEGMEEKIPHVSSVIISDAVAEAIPIILIVLFSYTLISSGFEWYLVCCHQKMNTENTFIVFSL